MLLWLRFWWRLLWSITEKNSHRLTTKEGQFWDDVLYRSQTNVYFKILEGEKDEIVKLTKIITSKKQEFSWFLMWKNAI